MVVASDGSSAKFRTIFLRKWVNVMIGSEYQPREKGSPSDRLVAGTQRVNTLHLHFHSSVLMGPPFKILELEEGTLLVSDELNHRLLHFDPQGELIWQLGGKGNALGKFYYPRGIAVVGNEIFVCDSWNHRIQVFDMGARPLRSIGNGGSGKILFDECSDVEVDPQGRLWVVDTGNHCIKVLTRQGEWIRTIGRRLSKAEEMALQKSTDKELNLNIHPGFCYPHRFLIQYPFGFCVDDRGNDRILLLSHEGHLCAEMDTDKREVSLHQQGSSPSWPDSTPPLTAFLKGREIQVVNWRGEFLFKAPAWRFAEAQSHYLQTKKEKLLQVLTFDWTNQDIVKYNIALSLPPEECRFH
jgi:hypothetical protein